MLWLNTKRVIRSGFINFWRNGFVSLASILVMVITLFVIGSIIFTSALLTSSLNQIKDKVDINVYMATNAQEGDIMSLKTNLESLPEVQGVEYISREQALQNFKDRHANDELTLQALDELEDNPLGAVLNVKARETSQYENIATYLQGKNILSREGVPFVDKVNYTQNKTAIEKLTNIIDAGQKLGLILSLLLAIISILITFNTIRLAIFISRDEISVMKLVGASNKYIRGPFVVIGIMYGVVAAVITLILFYPATYWLGQSTANFFTGINIFNYYLVNFAQIFAIIILSGIIIGAVSSFLAVKKYLNV
jgi:cell division transport system permease protein